MNLFFHSLCLLITLLCAALCESYNILVIFGHPGKSHYDVFKPLFQELGQRGHRITIISHVKTEGDIKNCRDVILTNKTFVNMLDIKDFPGNRLQKYFEAHLISRLADFTCEPSLQSADLQRFLQENNKFDIILTEFFNTNCFYGLITKYKAPFIGLSSCSMMAWHPQWFGSPNNPSYISSIYMAYPVPMSFLQRAENVLMHMVALATYKVFMEIPGRTLSLKYTGYEPADPSNASLLLVNTHYSLHGARPLTPSIVEVGGIHVANRIPKKLPKDIEKWTNESSAGLIYLSLGSLVMGDSFPKAQLEIFLKVLSELPQKVVWKWESDNMKNKPDNIMLTKWAPQFDILCHPNTVLFISHGGLLGTTETVHCGVPVLVLPQFGDQNLNAEALKAKGAAVLLKLKEITEEELRDGLAKALSKKTNEKMKILSETYKDRLVSPVETAVYWIEHIAKNKGGDHLRSSSINMPFYQYFLLDVILFYLFILLIIFYSIYKFIAKLFRKINGNNKQKLS